MNKVWCAVDEFVHTRCNRSSDLKVSVLNQSSCSDIMIPVNRFQISRQTNVGETGASCYRGRLLQEHFMQNYYIDGEIADSSSILIHQGNH